MHATTYDLGTVKLSAIGRSPAGDLRATVVALHGGGYSAGYWDHPVDPSASLLTVGAELGYRVVALDRPGYGAAFGLAGEAVRVANQVPVLFDCIDAIRRSGPVGAGCFLMGHSMGAIVAIHMAASARGGELLGIDVSGVPLHMDGSLTEEIVRGMPDHMPDSPVEFRRGLFYGPDGTFDPAVLAADEAVTRPIPSAEIIDAVRCGVDVPEMGRAITVPVQFTRAEFEVSSLGGREQLDEARGIFASSTRYEGHWQVGSGHNISLHRVARGHHLRAIAFFDEVLA